MFSSSKPAVALAFVVGFAAFDAQAAIVLQSHRAVYDLVLISARSSSGIAGLEGRMALEWAGGCEGATFNQRMGLRIDRADDNSMLSDFVMSTWESDDGKRIRFTLKESVNREVTRALRGEADVTAPDGSGSAHFTVPEGKSIALPSGTLFPTAHMLEVLERAAAGETLISRKIFELSSDEFVYDAVAFVSKTLGRDDTEGEHHALLDGLRSWRMTMGFFGIAEKSDLPQYEVAFRVYENGVSTEVELDYGDFKVRAHLAELTYLPDPDC